MQDSLQLNYDIIEFQKDPQMEVKLWHVIYIVFVDCLLTTDHYCHMKTGDNLKTGHLLYYA